MPRAGTGSLARRPPRPGILLEELSNLGSNKASRLLTLYITEPLEAKPVTVAGEAIAAWLAQKHQDARAILALESCNGAPVPPMSRRRAAKLLNVTRYRIASAALATPDEIECLKLGRLRLSDVRRAHAQSRKAIDDATIVAFINRVDPNRVLAILNRMTAPFDPDGP